ncbi:C2 domain protein [Aphelenchoides besseyi]|nr:C2 domain protein [Aphelenchoides besseyi]
MCIGEKKNVRAQPNILVPIVKQKGPSHAVELTISARNLYDRDVFSKSDPICVAYRDVGQLQEVGRTEQIQNCLNPDWAQKVKIDYHFETKQPLVFKLWDIDNKSPDLSKQDFLGECSCDLAEILAAQEGQLTLNLHGYKKGKGTLILQAKEVDQGSRWSVVIKVQGMNLRKTAFLGQPKYFLEFYRFLPSGSRQLAHRTTVQRGTVNPEWSFEISTQTLCSSNHDQYRVFDRMLFTSNEWKFLNCRHKFLGSCKSTVNQLNGNSNVTLPLEKGNSRSGSICFQQFSLIRQHTFIEFVAGGMQLEFGVCIDLTASNGAVYLPTSLHYLNAGPTQYELALRAVLEICEHYNHSKVFEAMGFGARIPPTFETAHLFPLSLNPNIRGAVGVEGVIQAYKQCLSVVQLSGPTNFEPSIREFAGRASTFPKDGTRFQILLIITDGVITDMANTRTAIVQASTLPLAIIIVGVGNDDFSAMDALDSDNALLTDHTGLVAKRDIVQFVPFRQFMPNPMIQLSDADREGIMFHLAKEVLAEVPAQVTSYMKMMDIQPRPPIAATKTRQSDEKKSQSAEQKVSTQSGKK